MKKSILFVLFTFLSVTVFSQVTWNVKAGMNLSNYTGDNDMNAKVGFKIGGGLEYEFTDLWSLQPSLFISTKGAKYDALTVNAVYLELPVMAAARINVADNTNIVISAGPYFAYGVGGKRSIGDKSTDTFGDNGLNRFDAGLGLGVAAEFGRVVVGLDSQLGLAEVQKSGNPKNINSSITLGYKF